MRCWVRIQDKVLFSLIFISSWLLRQFVLNSETKNGIVNRPTKFFLWIRLFILFLSRFHWKFTYLRHETSKWWTGQDLFCIFRYMCNYMIIIFTFMYEPTERLDKLNDHLTKAIQISFFILILSKFPNA